MFLPEKVLIISNYRIIAIIQNKKFYVAVNWCCSSMTFSCCDNRHKEYHSLAYYYMYLKCFWSVTVSVVVLCFYLGRVNKVNCPTQSKNTFCETCAQVLRLALATPNAVFSIEGGIVQD